MSQMNGFMAKNRAGGKISSEYAKACGHPNVKNNQDVSPQPKKILTGKVQDKQTPASKPGEISK